MSRQINDIINKLFENRPKHNDMKNFVHLKRLKSKTTKV